MRVQLLYKISTKIATKTISVATTNQKYSQEQ